jgi:hypothetical protein
LIAVAAMVDTLRLKNLESVSPNTQDKRGSYRFVPSERRGAMRRARHQIKTIGLIWQDLVIGMLTPLRTPNKSNQFLSPLFQVARAI